MSPPFQRQWVSDGSIYRQDVFPTFRRQFINKRNTPTPCRDWSPPPLSVYSPCTTPHYQIPHWGYTKHTPIGEITPPIEFYIAWLRLLFKLYSCTFIIYWVPAIHCSLYWSSPLTTCAGPVVSNSQPLSGHTHVSYYPRRWRRLSHYNSVWSRATLHRETSCHQQATRPDDSHHLTFDRPDGAGRPSTNPPVFVTLTQVC